MRKVFDGCLFCLFIHVNYIFLKYACVLLYDGFNGYTAFRIKMNDTLTSELDPAWRATLSLCDWPLPLWTPALPMTYFWLLYFLLWPSVCVLPLTCPHTASTSAHACFVHHSTLGIPHPRKWCCGLPQASFPYSPAPHCPWERVWSVPSTHNVLIPLQIVSYRGREAIFKDMETCFIFGLCE